jgi:hypothetical protein
MEQAVSVTKRLNLDNIFIFLFLAIFPLGQVIRLWILQPLDAVVGLAAIYVIVKKLPRPPAFKYLEDFLFVAVSTWVLSIFWFNQIEVLYGLLYLLRLAAYFYFLIYVVNFVRSDSNHKKLLVDSLLVISAASAFFGWIQFVWVPSIKPFFVLGWDEHLYRLVGTFLDPVYVGLTIVFGLIISITRFIETQRKMYLFLVMFLLGSLAFTYSRASYLAFFAGAAFIGIYKKKIRLIAFIFLALVTAIILLPTSGNQILRFTRSFTAIARIANYKTTFEIFAKSPVFGIGYNNLCLANQKYVGPQKFSSHSCSGSDSSLLFILATTGIIGLIAFSYMLIKLSGFLIPDSNSRILISSFAALLIHSIFSNSLFYPWVMGWMVILLGISLRSKIKK